MNRPRSAATTALLAIIATSSSCNGCRYVLVYDINPNTANGAPLPPGEDTTAGLTLRVDGSSELLYAVTLNAGIYRSIPNVFDGAWIQLNASPHHRARMRTPDGHGRRELSRF